MTGRSAHRALDELAVVRVVSAHFPESRGAEVRRLRGYPRLRFRFFGSSSALGGRPLDPGKAAADLGGVLAERLAEPVPDQAARHSGLPQGTASFWADGDEYAGDFVKVALNVARLPGTAANVLPDLLRRWFGPDAGQPGTAHVVVFARSGGRLVARPAERTPEAWRAVVREASPP
jgi:hypothetical protein